MGYARSQGGTLALVFIVVINAQAGIGIFDTLQFLARAIARCIVHHDQLSNLRLLKNGFNNSSYSGPLVKYGHDDGEAAERRVTGHGDEKEEEKGKTQRTEAGSQRSHFL